MIYIDEEELPVTEGCLIRVAPGAARGIPAGDEALYYICVQAKEGSQSQATFADGIKLNDKASWMK